MELSSIFILIFVLIIDTVLIVRDIKTKLIFSGRKIFKGIIPLIIIAFAAIILKGNNFGFGDIIMCISILPMAFVGNKTGISEKGFLVNSYLTPWDKVESYSLEDQSEKYMVYFKTNIGSRKIAFRQEDKDDVKKYLSGLNKLRYRKK